jgi:uncharacterized protein
VVKANQPVRRRHVPQRSCVACRRTDSKRTLIRIVRTPQQGVQIDPSGKLAGRGAYLCQTRPCWHKALKSSALNRALKTTLTVDETAALQAYADSLPEALESEASDVALPG